jgi:hypothetical protein
MTASTATGLNTLVSGFSGFGKRWAKSKLAIPQINSKSLEMLTMDMDNPTEAAAMQRIVSRILIVFVSKIGAGVGS